MLVVVVVVASQGLWRLLELRQLVFWRLHCGRMLLLVELGSNGPSVHGGNEFYAELPIYGYDTTSLGGEDRS